MRFRGALALLLMPALAHAATQCPDPYGGEGTANGVVCTEWVSRFDGARDHAYVRLPTGYAPANSYDLVLWFHAAFQGESAIADPRLHVQVGTDYGAITVGMSQRGEINFLGDHFATDDPPLTAAARMAAKQDVGELLDQLAARFHIRHVIVAGGSMGGYTAYRLGQLYPEKISIMLGAVPGICGGGEAPAPDCTDSKTFAGSQAIYAAARQGGFDDKLLYNIPGALEDTQGILQGARALNAIMTGKPYYRYREVAGQGHVNFLADEYNNSLRLGEKWLVSNAAMPSLRTDVRTYIANHPGVELDPGAGYVAPTSESGQYLVSVLRAQGGRTWPPSVDGGVRPQAIDGALGPEEVFVPPPPGPDEDGGAAACGCQSGGRPVSGGAGMLLLALAFAVVWRRKR